MKLEEYLYTHYDNGANISLHDMEYMLPKMQAIQPKVIVEIGTFYGGSARMWRGLFEPELLITIDVKKRSADIDGAVYLHDGASQAPETVARVVELLDGREIDLLFIDGGHLYPEVKADFELYAPLVRTGGLILFHDIHNNHRGRVEVPRFWDELRQQYTTDETPKNGDSGLGLVIWEVHDER